MRVYDKVPWEECLRVTGNPPIGVRWVDTNKGHGRDDDDHRSRLVAQQYKTKGGDRPDLYSPTPPLDALKTLIALAASGRRNQKLWGNKTGDVELLHTDISRAYFNAICEENVYVKIPEEDSETGDEHRCAKLSVWLYGTRGAATGWERCYSSLLESIGFRRGKSSPCTFYHPTRHIRMLVHGDDFVSAGSTSDLRWLQNAMDQKFECKHKRLGRTPGAVDEIKVLNRSIKLMEAFRMKQMSATLWR